ncbi:PqqD family protein [Patescibacteria group bacterium]|nr:PqqD family protein [Patescibacteria group bacterium]
MPEKKSAKSYKINKGFIVQKLDDTTVIFDGEKSTLYTFNSTATFIFQKLKSGNDRRKIVSLLARKYGISEKKAQNDFNMLLTDLLSKKIITQKKE